jgi:hypothetical protein
MQKAEKLGKKQQQQQWIKARWKTFEEEDVDVISRYYKGISIGARGRQGREVSGERRRSSIAYLARWVRSRTYQSNKARLALCGWRELTHEESIAAG